MWRKDGSGGDDKSKKLLASPGQGCIVYSRQNAKVLGGIWKNGHNDLCEVCVVGGTVLCCDFCNVAVHPACINASAPTSELWACRGCVEEWKKSQLAVTKAKRRKRALRARSSAAPAPAPARTRTQTKDQASRSTAPKAQPVWESLAPRDDGDRRFTYVWWGLHEGAAGWNVLDHHGGGGRRRRRCGGWDSDRRLNHGGGGNRGHRRGRGLGECKARPEGDGQG